MTDPAGTPSGARQSVQILQLIVGAMTAGLLVAAGILVLVVRNSGPVGTEATGTPLPLLLLAILLPVIEAPAYVFLRQALVHRARQQVENAGAPAARIQAATQSFSTLVLVAGAMAESAGLLGLVVFLLTAVWWVLVVPAGAVVVLLAFVFPTLDSLRRHASRIGLADWPY